MQPATVHVSKIDQVFVYRRIFGCNDCKIGECYLVLKRAREERKGPARRRRQWLNAGCGSGVIKWQRAMEGPGVKDRRSDKATLA